MNALVICIAATALAIDVGWQRLPEGGTEYIIQLDLQTLEVLRSGKPLQSDIPPAAGEVRSYRIVVGAEKLPHDPLPAPQSSAASMPEPEAFGRKEPQPLAPRPLALDRSGNTFSAARALYEEQAGAAPADKPPQKPAPQAEAETPAKPWFALTFTLLGLFASFSANVYLGWIAWDLRGRYLLQCRAG